MKLLIIKRTLLACLIIYGGTFVFKGYLLTDPTLYLLNTIFGFGVIFVSLAFMIKTFVR